MRDCVTHDKVESIQARCMVLSGRVQGVGFRPFVYRLAHAHDIHGWVENRLGQVAIHAEGTLNDLQSFEAELIQQAPPHAAPTITETRAVGCEHYTGFFIRGSHAQAPCDIHTGIHSDIHIVADLPVCPDCQNELNDPADRRYRYPFINCTHCGPRYTLIRRLPYDRANTTMAEFTLCPACRREYETSADRRYHAEPIACPACGPELTFHTDNETITGNQAALQACVAALQRGAIVAVKGIGGYHLLTDATNDQAVAALRTRKPRPHKPLAVLMTEQQLPQQVFVNNEELDLLTGVQHPIVVLPQRPASTLSSLIAPQLREVGVILPYSPLHYLLLKDFGKPLVATSANISGEPVFTGNEDVAARLSHVVDAVLH
ncbi:MAG TPA: Sua5/YciO/YrdC/YwlC family protein, partial [Gammaproteobacteria bacterium]